MHPPSGWHSILIRIPEGKCRTVVLLYLHICVVCCSPRSALRPHPHPHLLGCSDASRRVVWRGMVSYVAARGNVRHDPPQPKLNDRSAPGPKPQNLRFKFKGQATQPQTERLNAAFLLPRGTQALSRITDPHNSRIHVNYARRTSTIRPDPNIMIKPDP